MRLTSTDEDSPRRFYEIIGAGKVYGPYHQGPPRKPNWVWVAYGVDALLAIQLLAPWLGERRRARARDLFGADYVPEGTSFHGKTRLNEPGQARARPSEPASEADAA